MLVIKQEQQYPVVEITPILNAPHHPELISIYLRDIKWAIPYKYMYHNRGVRIVTHSLDDHIVILKDQTHQQRLLELFSALNP
jgi:hypothetical protein